MDPENNAGKVLQPTGKTPLLLGEGIFRKNAEGLGWQSRTGWGANDLAGGWFALPPYTYFINTFTQNFTTKQTSILGLIWGKTDQFWDPGSFFQKRVSSLFLKYNK